jgi:hypothetical protein
MATARTQWRNRLRKGEIMVENRRLADKTRQDKTRQDKTRQDKTRQSE